MDQYGSVTNGLTGTELRCPYCGEIIELTLDGSAGSQEYVEDCSVCCRPMTVTLEVRPERIRVSARREDD